MCHSFHLKPQTVKLLYLSGLFIVSSIAIFMTAASHLAVAPFRFTAPDVGVLAEITFTTEVLSIDATGRTMEMDWYPLTVTDCPDPGFVADIFFDPDLLDSSSISFTSFPPFIPAYQLNTSLLCGGTSPVSVPVFRTVIKLLGTNSDPIFTTQHSSLQDYPFDVYSARITMYARDHNTGRTISLNVTRAYGVAVNFEVTPLRSIVVGDVSPQLRIDLKIGRSKAAKSFVILVAISNWLVASAFLVVTAATFVYPNPSYFTEVFVLPIGVLFAFTSIRANLPGAPPGFGARIDLFTILPVLVLVTLCSFFLLLVVLHQRIFHWDKPQHHLEPTRKSSQRPLETPDQIQTPGNWSSDPEGITYTNRTVVSQIPANWTRYFEGTRDTRTVGSYISIAALGTDEAIGEV